MLPAVGHCVVIPQWFYGMIRHRINLYIAKTKDLLDSVHSSSVLGKTRPALLWFLAVFYGVELILYILKYCWLIPFWIHWQCLFPSTGGSCHHCLSCGDLCLSSGYWSVVSDLRQTVDGTNNWQINLRPQIIETGTVNAPKLRHSLDRFYGLWGFCYCCYHN